MYETENESARGSVRWGSQCTTEAVGCHKDPKSWFFHIHTKMIVLIKRTNTTRRNDLRKDIQVSLVAVVAQKMVAVGWESGGEGGERRVGGDKLGPNGKVELEGEEKIFSCALLRKKNNPKTSPQLFGFE